MSILAVDTTHSLGSLSLKSSQGITTLEWAAEKSHSEVVFLKLQELLQTKLSSLKDLSALVINNGPGSFTGIRVSVNLIKTLSYSLNIPIYTYDSLSILAKTHASAPIVILNAHSGLYYFKNFNSSDSGILTLPLQELKTLIPLNSSIITDSNEVQNFLTDTSILFKTSTSEQLLSLHLEKASTPLKWTELVPFYIRKSSPEEKMRS